MCCMYVCMYVCITDTFTFLFFESLYSGRKIYLEELSLSWRQKLSFTDLYAMKSIVSDGCSC